MTGAAPSSTSRSTLLQVLRSVGARLVVLPVSAGLGLLTTRIVLTGFGPDVYAQYGLLVGLGALLPFTDLGLSAAVVNSVGGSANPGSDPVVRGVLVSTIRVLVVSAVVVLGVDVGITATGSWERLLGEALVPGSGSLAAAGCLAAIALALPLSFGQRVLTGIGRHHVVVLLLGAQTPIVLGVVLLARAAGRDGGLLAVVPYLTVLVLTAAATVVAARAVHPAIGRALRDAPRLRSRPGEPVMHLAWPMLVQLIVVPLAMQTDRVVLSHVDGGVAVAEYNLAAQLYLPVWQLVNAGGLALWPIFARSRAGGAADQDRPVRLALAFGACAAVTCAAITVVAPWVVTFASDGELTLPFGLRCAFAVLMVVQAAKYPLGIFLTDAAGLRFQAAMIVLMAPVNLAVSVAASTRLGAAGPVLGSIVGVVVFELGANAWYVRRRRRRRWIVSPRPDADQQLAAPASSGASR